MINQSLYGSDRTPQQQHTKAAGILNNLYFSGTFPNLTVRHYPLQAFHFSSLKPLDQRDDKGMINNKRGTRLCPPLGQTTKLTCTQSSEVGPKLLNSAARSRNYCETTTTMRLLLATLPRSRTLRDNRWGTRIRLKG